MIDLTKFSYSSEQVIMPTPVPPEDMDGMFKKVREEEEDFERLKHIAQQEREIMRAAKEAEEANQALAATQVNETPVAVATIGSKVRIVNGPYVNFDGLISDLTDDGKKVYFFNQSLYLNFHSLKMKGVFEASLAFCFF
jgi:transcription antitermination factor NusG